MKKLVVSYTNDNGDSITLYDGEVTEVEWAEGSGSVRVAAKIGSRKSPKSPGANGSSTSLLEALTGAARNRNAAAISEKRAEFNREKAELKESASVAVVDDAVQ